MKKKENHVGFEPTTYSLEVSSLYKLMENGGGASRSSYVKQKGIVF